MQGIKLAERPKVAVGPAKMMSRQSSIQRHPSGFAIKDNWVEIGSVSNWPNVLRIVGDGLSSDLWLLLWNSQ